MELIKINNRVYRIRTKAAELSVYEVRKVSNYAKPKEFETDEGFVDFITYARRVLTVISNIPERIINDLPEGQVVTIFNYANDLITELETLSFQIYEPVQTNLPYPIPVVSGAEYVYGHDITAGKYLDASDIVSSAVRRPALLGMLPYIYGEISDNITLNEYNSGGLPFAIAIDFLKIHLNISENINTHFPILTEKAKSGDAVTGIGSRGIAYEMAMAGIAPVNELLMMNVFQFFEALAYIRSVNKIIKKKYETQH